MYLSLDVGTQSSRAILFDQHGELIEQATTSNEYNTPKRGWLEHNADQFWRDIKANINTLGLNQDLSKVRGLSVTTQAGSTVCCDESFKPLRPAIIWPDQRQANVDEHLGLWENLFRLIGQHSSFQYFRAEADINWVNQNQPEIYKQIKHYGLLSTFIHSRLLNRWVDSTASQVGYLPFNFRKHRWEPQWDWKNTVVNVQPSWLAELIEPGNIMGELPDKIANELGLPKSLPVISSGADKACEVLGSGALDLQTACLSFGTQASICVVSKKYKEAVRLIPPFPSAVSKHFNMMIVINKGFSMLRWFIDEFGQQEKAQAIQENVSTESILEKLLKQSTAGCHGLMLQPYWNPGLKEPGREAKGAIIGFGEDHDRADIYRAIFEGLAYAMKEGLLRIERKTKKKVTSLMVSGGGSQSDGALQITADIFNLPVTRPHTFETSALGAAINIAVALKDYPTVHDACKAMVHNGDTFLPNPENVKRYDRLFNEVYLKLYKQLKPLYKKIKQITGYPSL